MSKGLNTRGIDGIRGIAALGIALFAHYYLFDPQMNFPFYGKLTYWFWNYSVYFVDLFFVISGFVMAYAYEDKIAGEVSFVPFIKRRLLRLYPFMVFALFLTLFLQLIYQSMVGEFFAVKYVFDNTWFSFIMNLLCLQSTGFVGTTFNTPSWYVSAIILLYILFYFLVWVGKKLNITKFIYLLPMVAGIVIAYLRFPTYIFNCRGLVGFFAGCILYHLVIFVNNIDSTTIRNFIIYGVGILWTIFCLMICIKGHSFIPFRNDFVVVFYELIIWPGVVWCVLMMPFMAKIFSFKGFTFWGKVSYHMYLIHYPVMVMMACFIAFFNIQLNYESKKLFLIYVMVLIIVSVICYYSEEKIRKVVSKRSLKSR